MHLAPGVNAHTRSVPHITEAPWTRQGTKEARAVTVMVIGLRLLAPVQGYRAIIQAKSRLQNLLAPLSIAMERGQGVRF